MKYRQKNKGVTLTELAVTLVIAALITLTIGVVMLDSHRGWLDSWRKVHGGAADDAVIAQAAFEKVVRKSFRGKYLMAGSDDLTVYYYADWQDSSEIDRYARFYRSTVNPSELYLDHGAFDGSDNGERLSRIRLCTTVTDVEFKPTSGGIEMKLVLDDGRETATVVAMAILHNE